MWNGNAVTLRAFFLAASALLIDGCDVDASSRQAANDASQIEPPNGRHQVDSARNRVWFLTAEGVFVHDASRPQRIEVSLPGWVWVGAPYGCLPDLALGPKGEAVITSNVVPTLWRVDPDTLAVSVHPLALDADGDKDVGFSGLAYSSRRGVFYAVSSMHGSLWRIDPTFRRAEKIPLSASIREACGLTVRPRRLQQADLAAGLCVRTPREGWTVEFAPDERSAYVRPASCGGRPGMLDTLSLKGE